MPIMSGTLWGTPSATMSPTAPLPVQPLVFSVARLQDAGHAAERSVQDTAGKVAYVAKPSGPPDTSSYMWGGYVVALGLYLAYIVLMLRRIARSRQQLAARGAGGDGSR